MNVKMGFRTSTGSSLDRTVVSGGFQELDHEDQRWLKHNASIIARPKWRWHGNHEHRSQVLSDFISLYLR